MPLRLFKASVQDVQRSNRYLVWLPGMPPDLVAHCINVNIPGEQYSTAVSYDPQIGENVIPWELPYDLVQNECTLTFMVDQFWRIRSFFDNWRKEVYDPKSGFGYLGDAGQKGFLGGGTGGYSKDVKIIALSRQHIPQYTVTLTNAYPKSISDINFDAAAQNAPAVFTIGLVYGGQVTQDTLGFVLGKIGVARPPGI